MKKWLGNKIALNIVPITRVNAETNLKDLSILFWQLLEKTQLVAAERPKGASSNIIRI